MIASQPINKFVEPEER